MSTSGPSSPYRNISTDQLALRQALENFAKDDELPLEDSVFAQQNIMEPVFYNAEELAFKAICSVAPLFLLKEASAQKVELIKLFGAQEGNPLSYQSEAKKVGISPLLFTTFRGVIMDVLKGVFRKLPHLLEEDSVQQDDVIPTFSDDDEIDYDTPTKKGVAPSESLSIVPPTKESIGSSSRITPIPSVPLPPPQKAPLKDPKRKESKGKKKQDVKKPSKSASVSSKPHKQRKKAVKPTVKRKIMTNVVVTKPDNVREIMVYDIPAATPQELILQELLNGWGNVIFISCKKQRKYQSVLVKIELNDFTLGVFERGTWVTSLGNIPVCWFPATWSLKQRKE